MLPVILALVTLAADAPVSPSQVQPADIVGDQWLATSDNFVVRNHHSAHDARQFAEQCERWRAKLQNYWTAETKPAWTHRCAVTVHSSSTGYLAAVGPGGSRTFGSSAISFSPAKEVTRRTIDVRGDDARGAGALPHEMTHVVLADLLGGRQPPRWADEGMAILADTHHKQMLHERDLSHGLAGGAAFRVSELLAIENYPHPSRVAAFYGQSASLTALLAKRDDPARFVEFLRRSLDSGYDQALRDIYHIQGVAHLERHWHQQRTAWHRGYHGVQLALNDPTKAAE